MQSFLTLALLFGSTLAAPLNPDKNELTRSEGAVGLEKRQVLPRSVIQIIDLDNGEDSEASTTDAFVIETTATSTTAFGTPTDFPLGDLGSTDDSQQPDPNGPISGLDKRQLDALTGLLGGLKPESLSKRQLDALTGLLGGLKPESLNKRQLDALTGLLGGLKTEGLNKRQLDALTGLLGPLLGGLGGAPPAVPPPVPVPGATTTADATTTTTGVIPTATDAVPANLEDFPTFGSE
ncbi:uncharacterized protein FSUBG_2054 [Fusarium subglutinans]|uniref:Aggrecan 1 n=1 Tax=Gibberella subglutinans TaxID=42677 RepID=A0A8H5QBT4_GIBSU|nr:uncharacterized protein FSUBG_2054 [Fusarium subglutinans]KAF5611617.1 hypothetical protein FSUBG_2054 [Fusarium subglutinans]